MLNSIRAAMKRTFIAIKINPKAKLLEAYTKLRNELKNEKIKWVDGDNFHVTLFFLGETSEEQISIVKGMLDKLITSHEAFEMNLQGLGVFKNIHKPRVLWAGIRNYEPLKEIKESLDHEMKDLGFTPDNREFKPHLTLARIKWIEDKNKLEHLILEHQDEDFQKTAIEQVIFYESTLKQTGPVYTPIGKFPLR